MSKYIIYLSPGQNWYCMSIRKVIYYTYSIFRYSKGIYWPDSSEYIIVYVALNLSTSICNKHHKYQAWTVRMLTNNRHLNGDLLWSYSFGEFWFGKLSFCENRLRLVLRHINLHSKSNCIYTCVKSTASV